MVAFRVAEDSTGESEERWATAFAVRPLPALSLLESLEAVVVVSAHPDDDVLAVGDLLGSLSARGLPIRSVVVTDGERSAPPSAFGSPAALGRLRRAELVCAYRRLGITTEPSWLAVPDGEVAEHEGQLVGHLRPMLDAHTVVLVPWHCDGHPDHDAVGRAAIAAAAGSGATLWQFPVWAWHWADPHGDVFPWEGARRWKCLAPASKQAAIECFTTQVRSVEGREGPVLPATVLERFHRPFEVIFT